MEKLKKSMPVLAVLLVAVIFIVSFFSSLTTDSEASGFVMGSPVDVKIYSEKDGDTLCYYVLEKIKLVDTVYLSHTNSTSAVYKLNNGETVEDKWFAEYLDDCIELSRKSEKFTLFSGEFKDLWKIENGGYVPTSNELAKVLEKHKNANLYFEDDLFCVNNGKLDLGALGKGTACDEAIEYLKNQKVEKALITVGGSIGMIGSEPYSIGVRNPFGNQNEYFGVLNITDCFVSTSGDYEKYFGKDGVRYSHIFDATTGSPVQNDLSSVTVVADNGMLSDFLSTVVYLEGIENGMKIAEDFDAEVIIVKKDKTVLISAGLQDKFTLKDESFSVSVIE